MAVNIFMALSGDLYVTSAYEDGHVMVFIHKGPLNDESFEPGNVISTPWKWERLYASHPHSQPVLSIDISPAHDYWISSSADALIVKHPIPGPGKIGDIPIVNYQEETPLKTINTKHSGQQGLRIRSDGKIFATAGWDSRVRVYSGKSMKELAVLKWHKDGCYSVAFGEVDPAPSPEPLSCHSEDYEPHSKIHEEDPEKKVQGLDFSLAAVQSQRNRKTQLTHWLTAGSKDGKISLWDIY